MIELLPHREIALAVGPIALRWYGIFYVLSFLLAWWVLPRLQAARQLKLTRDDWTYITALAAAGVLVGGRLGYVFLYEPHYFLTHPAEIFFIWQGGMASHGGLLGAALFLWYAARKLRVSIWALFDLVVIPAALGLALGRIGNFINHELYGLPTTLPWGVTIPGVAGLRHPVQLYAALANVVVAALCARHLLHTAAPPGRTTAWFLVLYSLLRLLVSVVREPEVVMVHLGSYPLATSQLLTVVLLGFGLGLLTAQYRHRPPVRAS